MVQTELASVESVPKLPSLPPGLVLLESPGQERLVGPLDSLVLDHLLCNDGDVVWIDSRGHATTQHLTRIAPSMRLLKRIRVARGFTAHQHYSLVERVVEQTPPTVSLVVVPWVDSLYRESDVGAGERARMLECIAERLSGLADSDEMTVLVTREADDEVTAPFQREATEMIECRQTRFGPRFVGEAFETLVYDVAGGGVQTTLAFWERVVERRFHAMEENDQPVTGVA